MEGELREQADISSRVAITVEQMEGLLKFIEQNPALAKGKTKPQRLSQQLWSQCSKKLNTYKDGAKKNGKQWAKSWTDMKYRVRRRALELQAARAENKPLPDDLLPLSRTEERILSVIGKESLEKVVIKCDPATWDTDFLQDTNNSKNTDCLASPIIFQSTSSRSDIEDHAEDPSPPSTQKTKNTKITGRKQRLTPRETSDEQSFQPVKKPRLNNKGDAETDSDSEDSVTAFIEMEKKKIKSTERLTEAVCDIRDQMTRLIEVFAEIKDALIKNRNS